jgi:hypothetical protein
MSALQNSFNGSSKPPLKKIRTSYKMQIKDNYLFENNIDNKELEEPASKKKSKRIKILYSKIYSQPI